MADYVMTEDEDQTAVVQELLANAEDPDHVQWRPRSGVPHGGVYEVPDDLAEKLLAHRRARADAQAQRIATAQAAADERDSSEAVASGLVTPAEAGFAANATGDPGAPVEASGRDFDAHVLSDEEWAEKYPGEERPELGTGELPEESDEAGSDDTADQDGTAKPARSKRSRRAAAAKTDEAPAAPAEETK